MSLLVMKTGVGDRSPERVGGGQNGESNAKKCGIREKKVLGHGWVREGRRFKTCPHGYLGVFFSTDTEAPFASSVIRLLVCM